MEFHLRLWEGDPGRLRLGYNKLPTVNNKLPWRPAISQNVNRSEPTTRKHHQPELTHYIEVLITRISEELLSGWEELWVGECWVWLCCVIKGSRESITIITNQRRNIQCPEKWIRIKIGPLWIYNGDCCLCGISARISHVMDGGALSPLTLRPCDPWPLTADPTFLESLSLSALRLTLSVAVKGLGVRRRSMLGTRLWARLAASFSDLIWLQASLIFFSCSSWVRMGLVG